MLHCIFLVSAVTLGYVLTSEDLELGASNKKEHMMFVFLALGYFIHYDLFKFHSFFCKIL